MASDLIALGTVPAGEASAAASESDYAGRAFWQCRRFIALLRHTLGAEPEGAKLRVRRSGPDFHRYVEVVVEFDDARHAALDRRQVAACDHATGGEHARVRQRGRDVVPREAPVEGNRGGEALDQRVNRLREAPRPGLLPGGSRGGGARAPF